MAAHAEEGQTTLESALERLRLHYDTEGHGVEARRGSRGLANPHATRVHRSYRAGAAAARPQRLSAAALETLAIIAYRQPIGRAEIEEIRGVGAGAILKSLQERGLIDVVGRGEGLGRPLLYGTTGSFLEQFALRHLEELPRADELAIALRAPRHATPAGATVAPTKENGEAPRRAD